MALARIRFSVFFVISPRMSTVEFHSETFAAGKSKLMNSNPDLNDQEIYLKYFHANLFVYIQRFAKQIYAKLPNLPTNRYEQRWAGLSPSLRTLSWLA